MAKKKVESKIVQLDDEVFFLEGAEAVVEFTQSAPRGDQPRSPAYGSTTTSYNQAKGKHWVGWYDNDNGFPQKIVEMTFNNNINPGILFTKSDFISGQELITYRENIVDGKKQKEIIIVPEFEKWKEDNEVSEYLLRAATDYVFFGNVFTEFRFGKFNKQQLIKIDHLDSTLCRSGYKDNKTGMVTKHYVSTAFTKTAMNGKGPIYDPSKPRMNNVVMVPAYDRADPTKYPKCILHTKRYVPGYPYYSPPEWIGNMNWIKMASEIPLWHYSGMKNGYNIRWHIQIPASYFGAMSPEKREAQKANLRDQMNTWLAGSENVGKAFVSFYGMNGTLPEGWKIEALDAKLNDQAYSVLFDQSNMAIISGHGIDPTLCGVETAGKLSSGSEKRLSYMIYIALKTPTPRKILLKPFYEAKRINGWDPEMKFGIENTELTTLDVNPTGNQQTMP